MSRDAITSLTIFCVILTGVRGAEDPGSILTSPCQGEVATRRLRAAGEGPNSKFFAASFFCVILSAAKSLAEGISTGVPTHVVSNPPL